MAISTTGTGVRFSRGRGAAAVALDVSFKDLERWAKRQAINTPRLFRRSFGRACSGLKKQLAQIMRQGGGVQGVPKFRDYEAFTAEYRRETDRDPTGPIGGVLADKRRIVAFKRNGYQVIGWPDELARLALAFQDGRGGAEAQQWLENTRVRRFMHRAGIASVPTQYVHNPRMVIEPHFHKHVEAHLEEWATKIFYKDLARQMQKAGGVKI